MANPQMTLIRPSHPDTTQTKKGPPEWFTGDVYLDILHKEPSIQIAHVSFSPAGRTFWHHHEHGQLLRVLAGSGWVCDKLGEPQRLAVGDTVWCKPGTVHWHGADEGSYMVHLAVSHGKTSWLEEVTAEDFAKRK